MDPKAALESGAHQAPETAEEPSPAGSETVSETDTPSVEELVNDESIDLASTGLPDKTVAEIKRLRQETKQYREFAQSWAPAVEKWNPEDLEQLQTALAYGHEHPEEIGRWMIEQGQRLAGVEEESAGEPAGGGEPEAAANEAGLLTPEQVEEIIEARLAERDKKSAEQRDIEARVEAIKAQTADLGFGPSHVAHEALLSTARFKFDGDLAKAAEALIEAGLKPDTVDTNERQPAEAGTPVPPEGGTPAGSQTIRDPKKAAMERLNKVLPEGQRGFAEL